MIPGAGLRAVRDSTDAELDALFEIGKRLGGFDPAISAEWIDGALTALMAGPRVPASPAEAVESLFGDTWSRTFADPEDVARALAVLDARWQVLRVQLDPDAIDAEPTMLRLKPLLLDTGDAQQPLAPARPAPAEKIVPIILPPRPEAEGEAYDGEESHADAQDAGEAGDGGTLGAADEDADVDAEAHAGPDADTDTDTDEADDDGDDGDDDDEGGLRHGEDWARGVLSVVMSSDWGWGGVLDDSHEELVALLRPVQALALAAPLVPAWAMMRYPGEDPSTLTREDLEVDACYAMQELRLWWMDHAPRTVPRRAEPTPGRNDPCPCGSGKKYKKCHGAAA